MQHAGGLSCSVATTTMCQQCKGYWRGYCAGSSRKAGKRCACSAAAELILVSMLKGRFTSGCKAMQGSSTNLRQSALQCLPAMSARCQTATGVVTAVSAVLSIPPKSVPCQNMCMVDQCAYQADCMTMACVRQKF